jgi:hypothetical protein
VGWIDLTVEDAEGVLGFYRTVVGFQATPIDMGGYQDWCVAPPAADFAPVAGICHARGGNASLPPVWIVYFTVTNLGAALQSVVELGGEVIAGPKQMGDAKYAVVRDPAGAAFALYQAGS